MTVHRYQFTDKHGRVFSVNITRAPLGAAEDRDAKPGEDLYIYEAFDSASNFAFGGDTCAKHPGQAIRQIKEIHELLSDIPDDFDEEDDG